MANIACVSPAAFICLLLLQGRVSVGCAQMEEALQLLQDGGSPPLAPVLAAEIQEALEELKPAYVLDQLQVCSTDKSCALAPCDEKNASLPAAGCLC